MSDTLITVENVSKKFCKSLKSSMVNGVKDAIYETLQLPGKNDALRKDEFWAIQDVSFEVKHGECLGIIGPNGAGKSTLLKMLNGIILPDKGKITIRGKVGALIEVGAGFHPMLTGRENVYINGAILGLSKKEIDRKFDDIVSFAELEDFIDMPVKHYSSGMYVRLGFAIAVQMEPDILILDEVLAVGDIRFRANCFNAIHGIMKKTAVILVSHSMPQISRICSGVMVLNKGIPCYCGSDVTRGIDEYHSLSATPSISLIAGSGKATIHDIQLESDGRYDSDTIAYPGSLSILLDVTVDPSVRFFGIGIAFLGPDLQPVAHCHSAFHGGQFTNTGRRMRIVVNINSLSLNPGIYSVNVGIQADKLGEILIRHINCKTIRVTGDFCGFAPVQLQGAWLTEDYLSTHRRQLAAYP